MITSSDIQKIVIAMKGLVKQEIQDVLGLETGQTLNDKLSHLPSKEEFYVEYDKLMTELKAIREDTAIIPQQYKRLEKRVDKLDLKVFGQI